MLGRLYLCIMDDYKALRIVFMGTPEFAVASLQKLVGEGCNIVAVITSPDKPAGRGLKLQESAVKQFAVDNNIKVLQPTNLKNEDFLNELSSLKADLQIVVAFRMLPVLVWDIPKMGTINVHGSLLPQYRGAAPINWAIINGENETGVTTFKLKHEIDTGNILMQEKIAILNDETAGSLHDKMKEVGASILFKTIQQVANNSIQEVEQDLTSNKTDLKSAPKLFTDNCKINLNNSVDEVYNLVRGLSPYPTAFTEINGKKLKIFSCEKELQELNAAHSEYLTDNKTYLKFACKNGFISVKELQLEGKKKMLIEDFLRGNKLD